jgi:hypothetical protein
MTHGIHCVKNVDLLNLKARGAQPLSFTGIIKNLQHDLITLQYNTISSDIVFYNSTAWKPTALTTQLRKALDRLQ